MISKGMNRTPRAVSNRMLSLGLLVDMSYEKLNHSLRAHLIAIGLMAPPLPPNDDSNDISMTPVAPSTDANDRDYVQASSADEADDHDAETYDAQKDQLVHEGDLEVLASVVAHNISIPPPLI